MNYAGDVSPEDSFAELETNPQARLVDVRTQPEWVFVGQVDLGRAEGEALNLSWQVYPHMQVDAGFADTLKRELATSGASTDDPIYFLCRSGVRSLAAAQVMAGEGFTRCYNIAGGFEGDGDGEGHRGQMNGWKVAGLPWRQG